LHASAPPDGDKDTKRNSSSNQSEKTLYEILRVEATATRQEIKKQYFQLAKLSHPDAKINSNNSRQDDEIDFQEIAEAWRILGNSKLRRRYDRELRAKEWSENAQRFTNERLEKAVPVALDMMDKVAVPFLRRTTATTWAVGQAIASGFGKPAGKNPSINNSKNKSSSKTTTNGDGVDHVSDLEVESGPSMGLTDAFMAALEAGQQAVRAIDTIELNEKSRLLEER
jgi:DnaJ-class molecular chaperone